MPVRSVGSLPPPPVAWRVLTGLPTDGVTDGDFRLGIQLRTESRNWDGPAIGRLDAVYTCTYTRVWRSGPVATHCLTVGSTRTPPICVIHPWYIRGPCTPARVPTYPHTCLRSTCLPRDESSLLLYPAHARPSPAPAVRVCTALRTRTWRSPPTHALGTRPQTTDPRATRVYLRMHLISCGSRKVRSVC